MLTSEDRDLLGIAPEGGRPHQSSAVSQALRALRDDIESGKTTWDVSSGGNNDPEYRLRVACDRASRERAYRLAQRVYHSCGYVPDQSGMCVSPFDGNPQTLTILAQDSKGCDAGTISLIFDSVNGLPCDEIYASELDPLRASGRWLVEVTRLAIDKDHAHSKTLLVQLFEFISIYGRRVKRYTDFVIEVNPRHVNYYRRLLAFQTLGPERPCPRVNGAPAVLLRLDLFEQESLIRRIGGQRAASTDRCLYSYFCALEDEEEIAQFLSRNHKPMSKGEARYFNIECPPVRVESIATPALIASAQGAL
jgi:hypothetical protein